MEKFFRALAALLPTGFAWPRDPNSTLMRVIRGLAGAFNELHEFADQAVRQWQPATTVNRLAEWEQATGLPDACFTLAPVALAPGRYAIGATAIASASRASTATYFDAAGVLQTAAVNVPRFDFDPVTGASLGLLVEAASTKCLGANDDLMSWTAYTTGTATMSRSIVVDPVYGNVLRLTKTAGAVGDRAGLVRAMTGLTGPAYVIGSYVRRGTASTAGYAPYVDANKTGGGNITVTRSLGTAAPGVWGRLSAASPTFGTLAGNAGAYIWVDSAIGDFVDIKLPEVELGSVLTSALAVVTAPATRAADLVTVFPDQARTDALRRKLLLSRLRGPVLSYSNSSPASPDAIVAICAAIGYAASVTYNTPFRCGKNLVGDRLGALDGKLYATVTLQSKFFRVGTSRVGERLLEGQLNGGELVCYLQRVIPARYQLNVIFV